MSSSSSETDGSVVGAGDNGRPGDRGDEEWEEQHSDGGEGRISNILEEEIAASAARRRTGNGVHGDGYEHMDEAGSDFGDLSPAHTPIRNGSPADSMMSIPDDTPSIQGSVVSSPGSSVLPSMASRQMLGSPTPVLQAIRSPILISSCSAIWCLFAESAITRILPLAFAAGLAQ
ncbi:hypothetical protein VE04_04881 [Pseudogymnoascus sp. 24MN13]|nr:hypothetical protein VE04_04881 [Pseudogymnoascus sp. 24MN13]